MTATERIAAATNAGLQAAVQDDGPGAAVLVAWRDGHALACRGLADVAARTPVTAYTAFDLASMSKQFTAVAALRLVGRGQLALADELRRYLPAFTTPAGGRPIRLVDLLQHTSGLANYDAVCAPAGVPPDLTNAPYLDLLARTPLVFPTGTEARYSNSNYIALASVLERVSGRPFADFMAGEVFGPLGLPCCVVHEDPARPVPNAARGYKVEEGAVTPSERPFRLVGHSHLFATLTDLARWNRRLRDGRALSAELLAAAWSLGKLDDGSRHLYGYGWYDESKSPRKLMEHSGSWYGFHNYGRHYADQALTVVVLSNNEDFPCAGLLDRLAEAAFAVLEAAPA